MPGANIQDCNYVFWQSNNPTFNVDFQLVLVYKKVTIYTKVDLWINPLSANHRKWSNVLIKFVVSLTILWGWGLKG